MYLLSGIIGKVPSKPVHSKVVLLMCWGPLLEVMCYYSRSDPYVIYPAINWTQFQVSLSISNMLYIKYICNLVMIKNLCFFYLDFNFKKCHCRTVHLCLHSTGPLLIWCVAQLHFDSSTHLIDISDEQSLHSDSLAACFLQFYMRSPKDTFRSHLSGL